MITVSHGSAYTAVRSTQQQVNGKGQFWGCQNSVTPNRLTKNLTHVIVGELTSYAKFHKMWRSKSPYVCMRNI